MNRQQALDELTQMGQEMGEYMGDTYERSVIEFEAARNESMDSFYAARPKLIRDRDKEFYFEGGFRMAWNIKQKALEAQIAERDRIIDMLIGDLAS